MTNQQNFKKGDSVRVAIKDWRMSVDMGNDVGAIMTGDVGVVTGPSYDGDLIEVAFCDGWVRHDFGKDEIELVEPYDLRTDFLRRLGALLREFDAEIIYRTSRKRLDIDLGIGDNRYLGIEFPFTYYPDDEEGYLYIDADNIMEFEKE